MSCQHKLLRGKNKGSLCGKRKKESIDDKNFCKIHYNIYLKKLNKNIKSENHHGSINTMLYEAGPCICFNNYKINNRLKELYDKTYDEKFYIIKNNILDIKNSKFSFTGYNEIIDINKYNKLRNYVLKDTPHIKKKIKQSVILLNFLLDYNKNKNPINYVIWCGEKNKKINSADIFIINNNNNKVPISLKVKSKNTKEFFIFSSSFKNIFKYINPNYKEKAKEIIMYYINQIVDEIYKDFIDDEIILNDIKKALNPLKVSPGLTKYNDKIKNNIKIEYNEEYYKLLIYYLNKMLSEVSKYLDIKRWIYEKIIKRNNLEVICLDPKTNCYYSNNYIFKYLENNFNNISKINIEQDLNNIEQFYINILLNNNDKIIIGGRNRNDTKSKFLVPSLNRIGQINNKFEIKRINIIKSENNNNY